MPDFPISDPQGARGSDPAEAERRRQAALEEELEAARLKRDRYQALLKELPEVFEGKFQERVRPLQQRQQQLIEEGEAPQTTSRSEPTTAPTSPPATEPGAALPPPPRVNSEAPLARGMLRVRTSGPSWIEVKSADGALLFTGELNGERQFPFGRGLRLRSGRADLVAIQMAGQPERRLGTVEMVDWLRFSPPGSPSP